MEARDCQVPISVSFSFLLLPQVFSVPVIIPGAEGTRQARPLLLPPNKFLDCHPRFLLAKAMHCNFYVADLAALAIQFRVVVVASPVPPLEMNHRREKIPGPLMIFWTTPNW